jgi:hypothetical protein
VGRRNWGKQVRDHFSGQPRRAQPYTACHSSGIEIWPRLAWFAEAWGGSFGYGDASKNEVTANQNTILPEQIATASPHVLLGS